MARPRIAITTGEPAGIGPELLAKISPRDYDASLIALGDGDLLRARGLGADWADTQIRHVPLAAPAAAGQLDPRNGAYVVKLLDDAIDGALSGEFDAIVTLPIQKSTIIESGWLTFQGHTEYFAHRTKTAQVVMMLAASAAPNALKVALATTHLPLSAVPQAITEAGLITSLRILARDLHDRWGIPTARILVAGLNPHAGEAGHLGREDDAIIAPAIAAARAEGIDARGPMPADTLFTPRKLKEADAVLAMYHDQGLPVLKYASFGGGINVTLGLPIIRTSVDHGTALDIAGRGIADVGSLVAALQLAITLARQKGRAKVVPA